MKFFVVCPRGLEIPLFEEIQAILEQSHSESTLKELGLDPKHIQTLAHCFDHAAIGAMPIKPTGGIEISGGLELAMLINLYSRIASRVLLQLSHTTYKKEEDIYVQASRISWEDWFVPEQTLRVDVTAQKSGLNSINFITLRIKDAICDRFRDLAGKRPSIETATPDVRVMAFLDPTHLTLYLDTSGEALFKRGWRDEKGAAPLKENLAAGILHLTGWQAHQPLFDPMCGSGTFLIEAAQIAKAIPPGAIRAGILQPQIPHEPIHQEVPKPAPIIEKNFEVKIEPATPSSWAAPIAVETGQMIQSPKNKPLPKPLLANAQPPRAIPAVTFKPTRVDLVGTVQGFGFQRLKPFQEKSIATHWALLKTLAQQQMQAHAGKTLRIAGSDIHEQMVKITQRNWQRAGLPGLPIVRQIDALVTKSPFGEMKMTGVLLFNPPYGERIDLKGGRGGDEDKKMRGARDPLPKNISDPALIEFLAQYGRHLKEQFQGWQVDVLTADMGLPGQLRMKETKRTPLFNGAIECRLFRFEIRGIQPENHELSQGLKQD